MGLKHDKKKQTNIPILNIFFRHLTVYAAYAKTNLFYFYFLHSRRNRCAFAYTNIKFIISRQKFSMANILYLIICLIFIDQRATYITRLVIDENTNELHNILSFVWINRKM